jgi:ectoine hydroxylase-related dioxygenase (phytanoyl-CoA dioxygenase family)
MPLTASHLRQFAQDGYTTVPDFFDAREVAAMRAELERFQREGLLKNVATDGDGKTHSQTTFNLQICPISNRSRFLRTLPFAAKVVAAIRGCIGDPINFWLDQIFLKPPQHGAGTSWHQDNAYFHQPDPTAGVGMWIALHDAHVRNGCMHVVPRSHVSLRPHVRDPGSDHHIFAPEVDDAEAVPIELPAGGILLFNWGILHCTKGNHTDRARAGLALHFYNADKETESAWKEAARPAITGARATGGVAEYGERIEGTWEAEVERMLTQPAVA